MSINTIQQFYSDNGVIITSLKGSEFIGTCPSCEKENHFYIKQTNGVYLCHHCGFKGNPRIYLRDIQRIPNEQIDEILKKYNLNNGKYGQRTKSEICTVYDYENLDGQVVHQTIKYHPKRFSQRRPDGKGGYIWNLNGVHTVLYRLPAIVKTDTVIICEGEKDADNIVKYFGIEATTCPMGAGKWKKSYNQYLKDKVVIIVFDRDNDPKSPSYKKGYNHAINVANSLFGTTKSIKIVGLPKELNGKELKDISNYIDAGGNKEDFLKLIEKTGEFKKTENQDKKNHPQRQIIIETAQHAKREALQYGGGRKQEAVVNMLSKTYGIDATISTAIVKEVFDSKWDDPDYEDVIYPYAIKKGFLFKLKATKDGDVPIPIANFTAEIIKEKITDNGAEQSHNYIIVGKLHNEQILPEIEIPASSFPTLNWPYKWGTRVIIEPGQTIKDYIRHFILKNSKAEKTTCYTHIGWRKLKDKWVYLTSSGAIGIDNVTVELSKELARYSLPLEIKNEREAIEASLSFLDIGKHEITYPLFTLTYLSTLTTLLDPMPNFSGYIYGDTATFKTTVASLPLSHFGDFSVISDLANFDDTANNVERKAFILKDTLIVLDDYHPSAQRGEAQKKENLAQRTIRAYSNRTARGRLNSDCTVKQRYSPGGMLLVTGEELVSVSSTLARVMVIEITKGDIDKKKLTELQNKMQFLPHAMASYISWLRNNIDDIQQSFKKRFIDLRRKASSNGQHGKYPEQVAFLVFALETVLSWLTEKDVITKSIASEIIDEAWNVFNANIKKQTQRLRDECPIQKFKDILNTALEQKKVRIVPKGNATQEPNCSNSDNGDLIGYSDDTYYYLLPQATWKLIDTYGGFHSYFPVSKNALWNLLAKRGLIKTNGTKNVLTERIGPKVTRVIKLCKTSLQESE